MGARKITVKEVGRPFTVFYGHFLTVYIAYIIGYLHTYIDTETHNNICTCIQKSTHVQSINQSINQTNKQSINQSNKKYSLICVCVCARARARAPAPHVITGLLTLL